MYIPADVTVMELVDSPVFHNIAPVTPVAVNIEFSQLLLTDIPGTGGIGFGAAATLAAELVQPFSVCVTE